MKSTSAGLAAVLCSAASVFVPSTCADARSPAQEWPSVDQLPAACLAAKADFHPLTKADLQQVKAELLRAAGRLDRRLRAAGKNGADWKKYLLWEQMQSELRGDQQPDLAVLDEVYKRYTAGDEGLELVWFLEVREALRHYREMARNVDNPKLKPAYERLLDALAPRLEAYAAEPTAEEALVIGHAVRQLEDARQAPALVAAVRHHFLHPNLLVAVSREVLSAGIARPVDETEPVRDVILKTDIFGTGHTTGEVNVELVPREVRGVVDTIFLGTVKTRNVGYRGPVMVFSNATTRVGARKRFWIDAQGLASLPAASTAVTETEITGISATRFPRLVERIAWRRATKQKSTAEWVASRHAEQRVNDRIDGQGGEMVTRANEAFAGKFRRPFDRRNLFPQQLRFSTTDDALRVLTLQADRSQLAAPGRPPELVQSPDLGLRVHESMINNLAASALSGMTLRRDTFHDVVVELLGELPDRFRMEAEEEPWTIVFARRQPIWVKFADDGFSVTVRGRRYYKGEDRHPGMDVTAVYKVVKTEQGLKATRQGELEIFPPGFVPGSGRTLSAREMVIRTLLERRFGQIFTEEMMGEGLVLPGKWEKAGRLRPVQLSCKDGWLTVAWRRVPSEAALAETRR